MPLEKQLEIACAQLADIPELRQGFNAFGESQGGILMRAIVQKCSPGPINNFVTLSSPHQGIYGIPKCTERVPKFLCSMIVSLFSLDVYSRFVQGLLTAAEYWHDPLKEDEYRRASAFLAELNNERNFNIDFKRNLSKVNKFIMIRNTEDEFIVPNYSAHFGFFAEGSVSELENFTSTRVYREDLLGLRTMSMNNQLVFENIPGGHCHLNWTWFEEFTIKYFK
ncbi:palmitoyl-protein thioesterase 1 [Galendromus occidentalis]|uniref:Palmitoyl-protein thioesterase 1 n=1 Tax=Galendromus occidentalis TaxID=34638 RepID=A0AAJ6QQQ1_9ACAR|nr:palmitoyl-protein thioesterase 1 [Galendromus occidentalis]